MDRGGLVVEAAEHRPASQRTRMAECLRYDGTEDEDDSCGYSFWFGGSSGHCTNS